MSEPAVTTTTRRVVWSIALLIWAAGWFGIGLDWGLPTRADDSFLFGEHPVWTGAQIMTLAGSWNTDPDLGSDRAQHPVVDRSVPVVLNSTDADRAEIIRRYRLYSRQPDEMNTFRALSRMSPGRLDLDPRMYQYGGLWIYPVGGLLKIASVCGLATIRSDVAYYLDHPESFGRFYLIARLYGVAWGLAGIAVVYGLTRRLSLNIQSIVAAVTASALFAVLPVVVNAAHEAKPHLAGVVLILSTMWVGLLYADTGKRRWLFGASVLAGGAMGMVLTGVIALTVPVVMVFARPGSLVRRCKVIAIALIVAVTVFAMTNPFIVIDAVARPARLHSNVGNYGNFYRPSVSAAAVVTAGKLLLESTSVAPLLGIGVAICAVAIRRRRLAVRSLILIVPTLVVAIQFVLFAAGKPAEYARFALLPAIMVSIGVSISIARLKWTTRERSMAAAVLIAATAYFSCRYEINYLADHRAQSTRVTAARAIQALKFTDQRIIVDADPAPYDLPAVDLFTWTIELSPRSLERTHVPPGSIRVTPTDSGPVDPKWPLSPISWANKPIRIERSNAIPTQQDTIKSPPSRF